MINLFEKKHTPVVTTAVSSRLAEKQRKEKLVITLPKLVQDLYHLEKVINDDPRTGNYDAGDWGPIYYCHLIPVSDITLNWTKSKGMTAAALQIADTDFQHPMELYYDPTTKSYFVVTSHGNCFRTTSPITELIKEYKEYQKEWTRPYMESIGWDDVEINEMIGFLTVVVENLQKLRLKYR